MPKLPVSVDFSHQSASVDLNRPLIVLLFYGDLAVNAVLREMGLEFDGVPSLGTD